MKMSSRKTILANKNNFFKSHSWKKNITLTIIQETLLLWYLKKLIYSPNKDACNATFKRKIVTRSFKTNARMCMHRDDIRPRAIRKRVATPATTSTVSFVSFHFRKSNHAIHELFLKQKIKNYLKIRASFENSTRRLSYFWQWKIFIHFFYSKKMFAQ